MSSRTIVLFCAVAALTFGMAAVASATPITVFDNQFNVGWDIDTNNDGVWDQVNVSNYTISTVPAKYRETGGTTSPQIWTATIATVQPWSVGGVYYSGGGLTTGASTTEFTALSGWDYTVAWNSTASNGGSPNVQVTATVYSGSGTGGTVLATDVMGVNQSHTFSFGTVSGAVTLETKLTLATGTYADTDFKLNYVTVTRELVPEPSTIVLLASALIGLLCYAWRKRK